VTAEGPSAETGRPDDDAAGRRLQAALRAMAPRIEAVRRLSPGGGTAVLRSIVETTAVLFGAEAASIALHDPATDRLARSIER